MRNGAPFFVMPGLGPGIHVFLGTGSKQGVDGRNTSGHDGVPADMRRSNKRR
jgi:hypothetical protein